MPSTEHHETVAWPGYTREAPTIAKLPSTAAAKLREFEDAALAAEGAVAAARAKRDEKLRPVTMLRQSVAQSTTPHPANLERLAQLEPELEHREEVLRRFQAERIAANVLHSGIRRALEALPPSARLVAVELPEPKKATLVGVRETVASLKRDIATLENSAPTIEEQTDALRAAIAEKAKAGQPRFRRDGGLKVSATTNPSNAALGLLCWLDPEGVLARMVESGALRDGGTLTAAEKAAQLADLRARLFEAEVLEETLLLRDGGTRRADADPFAVLGVRVEVGVKRQAA